MNMHSLYITRCCILNEKDKLLLLKYAEQDITNISQLLYQMTLELMNQCYSHVEAFHNLNKQKNKKYATLEPLVIEQMKDMLFIKKKFIEYFTKPGNKTKEDLFTYIFAFQISANYYNEYLYRILIKSMKEDLTPEFWSKHNLDKYNLNTIGFSDLYILKNKKEECSTGSVNLDFGSSVDTLNKYANSSNKTADKINNKLAVVKDIGHILDNYYNSYDPNLNEPFKDTVLDLVDHIKVYRDMERPIQHIKRI